ncbi:MAG: peptidoglycan recognition family protein [Oscillochloridaceae bacterium umkhey_bin13]
MCQPSLAQPLRVTLLILVALASLVLPLTSWAARAQQPGGPQSRTAAWNLSAVNDWQAGTVNGVLITNNAGGELRLAEDQTSGSFLSAPFQTSFATNAIGATWQAQVPPGTGLRLELRARANPPEGDPESGWGAWQPLERGDALSRSGVPATPGVLALPADSQFLQLRVSFTSEVARASAVLEAITLSYLSTTSATPTFAAGLPRRPILFGPLTLTTRPAVIARSDWSGRVQAAQPARRDPQGVIVHQLDAELSPATSLDFVRALATYQTELLGWEDLAYHYLIDPEGNLFEGRLGGPTSATDRLSGGGAAVHIALINPRAAALSPGAQASLISLLAWLGEAYRIAPTGEHRVNVNGTLTTRPNLAGHAEVVPTAPDPFPPLRNQLPQLRTRADQSTVRARWYFAEGNVADYSQRLSFFNPTGSQTEALVTLVRPGAAPISQIVAVPANARADLIINELVQGSPALPAIVESSAPILVERTMSLTTDLDAGPGINQLSRVWYFAEGSTVGDSRTFLVLFNPNPANVQATLSYMRRDGVNLTQDVEIGAQSRLVVAVHDLTLADGSLPLRETNFGVQVVANQPIAAERTMRFGPNQAGLHTGRGLSTLARRWYFAEGTTENDFRYRLLLLNPNSQPASTEATFLGPDGQREVRRYAVPPRSQLLINVNEVIPNLGVSAIVDSDRPIAVERALNFNGGAGGTVSEGATAPHLRWAFVEGRTSDATYFLAVSNPGRINAQVTVDLRFSGGATATQTFSVAPGSRYTFAVHELYPNENAISAMVRSTQPIIAERSIFPGGGVRGGTTSLGIPMP